MKSTQKEIIGEIQQGPNTRTRFFKPIENELEGRTLVTLFTSFAYNVQLDDDDCDMLQSVLQAHDLKDGIALMLSTPGGDGLAAERIVNTLRAYSGTNDYWVIVPGKAKSAGTIVAMGASKLYMAPSSELGPVDPQIIRTENGRRRVFSAHALVIGYDRLFTAATQAAGQIEPYLQQLSNYDDREINSFRAAIDLSEDIAKKVLASGMMKGTDIGEIANKIEIFLNPDAGTLSHGRPIYAPEAEGCGLVIEGIDVRSDFWKRLYELYVRTERFVSLQACKSIESRKDSFYVQAQS